jgi:hypothetical protein
MRGYCQPLSNASRPSSRSDLASTASIAVRVSWSAVANTSLLTWRNCASAAS